MARREQASAAAAEAARVRFVRYGRAQGWDCWGLWLAMGYEDDFLGSLYDDEGEELEGPPGLPMPRGTTVHAGLRELLSRRTVVARPTGGGASSSASPQILSAYDAQGLSASGAPRKVYFTDFMAAEAGDEVCDVAFAIG